VSNPFAGTWTYRSFLNNPTPTGGDPAKLAALLFAEGTWTLRDAEANVFDGELSFGANDVMDLKGVGHRLNPAYPLTRISLVKADAEPQPTISL